jgi:CRISPR/Cas system CMR-associated protein Cmr3 (group 5 of RAMP superfamily)
MKGLNKIVLSKTDCYEFCDKGFLFYIEVDRDLSVFRLKTTVFSEKNFIPFSIRECVDKVLEKAKKKKNPIYLKINESLNSVELIQEIFVDIDISVVKLERLFSFVARSWASVLKRIANQDLVEM